MNEGAEGQPGAEMASEQWEMRGYWKSSGLESIWRICVGLLGCHGKVPHTGRLQQWKHISLRFWRLEAQGQGACRAGFSEVSPDLQMAVCVSSWGRPSSLCVCVSLCDLVSSSYRYITHTGLGPSLWPHFISVASVMAS